ncbi:MAG: DivIVA domain-containing protein, partial [Lachnospiraceae bacterium]|nr:DivIVA domain-containing protein [Lachnospiraceae bacterium]
MLTPIELQNKSFKSGGLGYDKRDVDQFFKEVTEDYMRLYGENIDLKDKVGVLNEALHQYKAMEKTLQKALILAEKSDEELSPHLIQLMEWLQDLNWPGAVCIQDRLKAFSKNRLFYY